MLDQSTFENPDMVIEAMEKIIKSLKLQEGSRELSLAITKMQEAEMWFEQALLGENDL